MINLKGGCHCGAVTYEIGAEPVLSGHCQCTDCQKTTGGGHVSVIGVPETFVSITGDLTEYTAKSDSGNDVTRAFCPNCGTPVYTKAGGIPGVIMMRAGTLDDPSQFHPQMVIYTKSAQSWDAMPDDLQAFEEMPPMG